MVSEGLAEKGGRGKRGGTVSPTPGSLVSGTLLTRVTNASWFAQDIPDFRTGSPASWQTGTVSHSTASLPSSWGLTVFFEKDPENLVSSLDTSVSSEMTTYT